MLDCFSIISLFLIKPAETIEPTHSNHRNKRTEMLTNPVTVTFLFFFFGFNIDDIKQLKTLGVSSSQLFKIRIGEAIIHSVLILLVSVIFNLIILILVSFIGQLLGRSLVDISGFWQPSLIVISLLVIFYSITKGFYLFQDR